jgi:tungstate transport system substrate-binding protein
MGPTLNTAAGMDAYTLADRGSWASFKNRRALAVLLEGDAVLFNPYGSILVSHAAAKKAEARQWHDWLTGPKGQAAIASFRIGDEQLFFPAAR